MKLSLTDLQNYRSYVFFNKNTYFRELRFIQKNNLFWGFDFQNNPCPPAPKPSYVPQCLLKTPGTWDWMPIYPLIPAHFFHFSESFLVVWQKWSLATRKKGFSSRSGDLVGILSPLRSQWRCTPMCLHARVLPAALAIFLFLCIYHSIDLALLY